MGVLFLLDLYRPEKYIEEDIRGLYSELHSYKEDNLEFSVYELNKLYNKAVEYNMVDVVRWLLLVCKNLRIRLNFFGKNEQLYYKMIRCGCVDMLKIFNEISEYIDRPVNIVKDKYKFFTTAIKNNDFKMLEYLFKVLKRTCPSNEVEVIEHVAQCFAEKNNAEYSILSFVRILTNDNCDIVKSFYLNNGYENFVDIINNNSKN